MFAAVKVDVLVSYTSKKFIRGICCRTMVKDNSLIFYDGDLKYNLFMSFWLSQLNELKNTCCLLRPILDLLGWPIL